MKKTGSLLLAILMLLTSFQLVSAQSTTESMKLRLDSFKVGDLSLQGRAEILQTGAHAGFVQLTPAQTFVAGSAFYKEPVDIAQNRSFSAYFTMKMADSGKGGADGIMFVLSSNPYVMGSNGGGIGYLGVRNSIAVEFDTFNNFSLYADPDGNHIAVNANGDLSKPLAVTPAGALQAKNIILDDGKLRHVWIEYDGDAKQLSIRIADSDQRPGEPVLSINRMDLSGMLNQSKVYLGFTSATGDSFSTHLIGKLIYDPEFHQTGVRLVEPGNEKPKVEEGSWQSDGSNRTISGTVTATDAEKDTLQLKIGEQPKNGTVVLNPETGAFTYTARDTFSGVDSFSVIANDGKQNSDPGKQTLNVLPVNVRPEAQSQKLVTAFDTPISNKVTATDANLDPLHYKLTTNADKGVVILDDATGEFEYTPYFGQSGTDRFEVTVSDGKLMSEPAVIDIQIMDQEIVAMPATEQVESGKVLERPFIFQPSNLKLDKKSVVIVRSTANGTLTWDDQGRYRYVSNRGFSGTERFTFAVFDGKKMSNTAEITINVTPEKKVSYIYGYRDGQFKPLRSISRGELAAAIVRLTGMAKVQKRSLPPNIEDVKPTNWMYRDIVSIMSSGVMTTDTRGRFAPNRAVTRQELHAVLERMLQQRLITRTAFVRAQRDMFWLGAMQNSLLASRTKNQVRSQSVIRPMNLTGSNQPSGLNQLEVTRLEAVIIFNRMFNRTPIEYDESTKSPWSDVTPRHPHFADLMEASGW